MKIAICFYGLHPDECWKNINSKFDTCYNNWHKNVLSLNDCDIFMHSFSKKHEELLKYEPKKYLFEDTDYFDNNIVDKEKKQYYYNKYNEKGGIISIILYVSYGIKKTVELMNAYSNENNIEYDLILLSRIDVCWLNPLIFNELNTNKFYSAIWGKNNFFSIKNDEFLAYWFISNKEIILKLSKIYDNIYKYFEDTCSWHKITKLHVNSFLKEDSIEYKFNDICNENIDMDLQRYIVSCKNYWR